MNAGTVFGSDITSVSITTYAGAITGINVFAGNTKYRVEPSKLSDILRSVPQFQVIMEPGKRIPRLEALDDNGT